MEKMEDPIYGATRHSYYPILLLYQKYNFEVKILFQFVPNWISDEYNDIGDLDAEEIVNHVLNNYSDSLSEIFVQVYQTGDNYRLVFTNSKKYSNKMINEFKKTYISILSNINKADISSNLNDILK